MKLEVRRSDGSVVEDLPEGSYEVKLCDGYWLLLEPEQPHIPDYLGRVQRMRMQYPMMSLREASTAVKRDYIRALVSTGAVGKALLLLMELLP